MKINNILSHTLRVPEWIADQMSGRTCTVILVGSSTADRKWINHEIAESWNDGMGLVGINIHNLENSQGQRSSKGNNPLYYVSLRSGKRLSTIAKIYDPPRTTGTGVYSYISDHIEAWIEEAIKIRKSY